MIKADTSYYIVKGEDDFLNNLVISYLKRINIDKGLKEGVSLIGKSFIFDNKALPTKEVIIISTKKRSEKKLFKEINLKDNRLDVILDILQIEDDTIKKYVEKYFQYKSNREVIDYLLAYSNNFEDLKTYSKEKVFEDETYSKKFSIIVKAVATPSTKNLLSLKELIDKGIELGNTFDTFTYFMYNVINSECPEYLKKDLGKYYTKAYKKKVLRVSVSLLNVREANELLLTLKQSN